MLQWSAENSLLTAPHLLMMVDSISNKMSLPAISVNPSDSVQDSDCLERKFRTTDWYSSMEYQSVVLNFRSRQSLFPAHYKVD